MTKQERMAIATALLVARPPVIPGTNVIVDSRQRDVWYSCVTQISRVIGLGSNPKDASAFFDRAGVPN